jgi:hypothetical protein
MNRREALRRGGAAATAALLARALGPRAAQAQGMAPIERPERFVLFHHLQGTVLPMFVPTEGLLPADLPFLLEPFSPYVDDLLVYAGLNNSASQANLVGNSHQNANFTLFTGRPFPFQDAERVTAGGPDIVQILSERIGSDSPFPRLDFAVGGTRSLAGLLRGEFLFRALGEPIDMFANPSVAVARIFGDQQLSADEAFALRARRASVLDAVDGLFSLAFRRADAEGRRALEAHAEKIRGLENRLLNGPGACVAPSFEPPPDYDVALHDDVSLPAMIDVLVTTLACGQTRVASLSIQNGHDHPFPWLWARNGGPIVDTGQWDNWHAMVHADYQPGMEWVYRWYMEGLASLWEKLRTTPGPDGRPLSETTMVLYLPEFASGRHWTNGISGIVLGPRGEPPGPRFVNHFTTDLDHFVERSGYVPWQATTQQLLTSVLRAFGGDDAHFGAVLEGVPQGGLPGWLG